MSYTPKRTQYAFDLSGVKCKANNDLITFQRQWDTFERVENYDDIVYQKLQVGDRGTLYYQFLNRGEALDYKTGQIFHCKRYPWLPPSTFNSIRNNPFPNVPSKTGIPNESGPPRICAPFSPTQTSSEYLSKMSDLNTYINVSTFNSEHVYKHTFTSDEEKMAYYRAERQILAPSI
jgi:hypothetical protein